MRGRVPGDWERHAPAVNPFQPLFKTLMLIDEFGGREGIRTPGLLVANEEQSKLRHGATLT